MPNNDSKTRAIINGNGKSILSFLGYIIMAVLVLLGIYSAWVKGLYASTDRVIGIEGRVTRLEKQFDKIDGKLDDILLQGKAK